MEEKELFDVFTKKGYTPDQAQDIVSTLSELAKAQQTPVPVSTAPVLPKADDVVKIIGSFFAEVRETITPKWYKYAFDFGIILCVIVPISILGYGGQLNETTLGTLFGGIIGYTLSRFKKSGNQ